MSKKINPPISKGDRIVVIYTSDNGIPYGTRGTVEKSLKTPWGYQYDVKWDTGSGLYLLDEDKWMYEKDFDNRKNNITESMDDITRHSKTIKYFKMNEIRHFLEKLRESGVVNMFGASPYLWMGKERILNQHRYEDTNESFDDVLDMADKIQSIMINGVIRRLEDDKKEINPTNINRYLQRYSSDVLKFWSDHY